MPNHPGKNPQNSGTRRGEGSVPRWPKRPANRANADRLSTRFASTRSRVRIPLAPLAKWREPATCDGTSATRLFGLELPQWRGVALPTERGGADATQDRGSSANESTRTVLVALGAANRLAASAKEGSPGRGSRRADRVHGECRRPEAGEDVGCPRVVRTRVAVINGLDCLIAEMRSAPNYKRTRGARRRGGRDATAGTA